MNSLTILYLDMPRVVSLEWSALDFSKLSLKQLIITYPDKIQRKIDSRIEVSHSGNAFHRSWWQRTRKTPAKQSSSDLYRSCPLIETGSRRSCDGAGPGRTPQTLSPTVCSSCPHRTRAGDGGCFDSAGEKWSTSYEIAAFRCTWAALDKELSIRNNHYLFTLWLRGIGCMNVVSGSILVEKTQIFQVIQSVTKAMKDN